MEVQKQQIPEQTRKQTHPPRQKKVRRWVKVRYYVGANAWLYFHIDDVVERVSISGQKWAEPIINYVKAKGKHRVVKRRGFSHVLGIYNIYNNNVWVAKIAPKKLLRMITASPTWRRSEHAQRIAEILSKL